jgi:general secretion pathway protein D
VKTTHSDFCRDHGIGEFVLRFVSRSTTACCRILLFVLALMTSACQTIEDSSITNTWRSDPLPRLDAKRGRAPGTTSAPLLRDRPAAKPTLIEGTGRFVGDRSKDLHTNASDSVESGVTLNLVNVPVQQAANTILSDIVGMRYTIDPKIDGRVTIQTPSPITKSAAIDLFQSALATNGATIVNANGMVRIVPIDQAPVGAVI